jgi:hypothetical protein
MSLCTQREEIAFQKDFAQERLFRLHVNLWGVLDSPLYEKKFSLTLVIFACQLCLC